MMDKHPLAGKRVRIKTKCDDLDHLNGKIMEVEDLWINVAGKSWMVCNGNPACLKFAIRSAFCDLPTDNNVLYGKVGLLGHLVHESEVEEVINK
jgi:predicted ATP-dependent serine protease